MTASEADPVQQYRDDDHRQDSSKTEHDLHRRPVRNVKQRQVAGQRQEDAETIDWQRILAAAPRAAHDWRR